MSYIFIWCAAGRSHYTGITTDPRRRMREHAAPAPRRKIHEKAIASLRWTHSGRRRRRSEACRLESAVKRLRAEQKRALIAQPDQLHDFLGARIDASRYTPEPLFFSRRAARRTELTQNARPQCAAGIDRFGYFLVLHTMHGHCNHTGKIRSAADSQNTQHNSFLRFESYAALFAATHFSLQSLLYASARQIQPFCTVYISCIC